jgi:hypothetical protein
VTCGSARRSARTGSSRRRDPRRRGPHPHRFEVATGETFGEPTPKDPQGPGMAAIGVASGGSGGSPRGQILGATPEGPGGCGHGGDRGRLRGSGHGTTRGRRRGGRGGPGGRPPGQILRATPEGPGGSEHGTTPGGYGGKPPGVAFIGVPTGARNAGSGAPTGDQSTDMNATRKPPGTCQDPITSASGEKCGTVRLCRAVTYVRTGR